MSEFKLTTPVVFCIFSRLETTRCVFEQIRKAQPTKLYVVADAARENRPNEIKKVAEVRKYIADNINWQCEVQYNFAESNMGCGKRMPSGLDWVFEQEDRAIILEDDCVPVEGFFRYCQEMLEYYRDNDEIMLISGNNHMCKCHEIKSDYTFSKIPFIWGWATWKRSWDLYDFDISSWPENRKNPIWKRVFPLRAYWIYTAEFDELYNHKFDAWDYQMMYSVILNNKYCIVPSKNFVCNIGFQEDATHTKNAPDWMSNETSEVVFPIQHRVQIEWDRDYDLDYMKRANRHGLIVHIKKILGLNINRSIFEKMLYSDDLRK